MKISSDRKYRLGRMQLFMAVVLTFCWAPVQAQVTSTKGWTNAAGEPISVITPESGFAGMDGFDVGGYRIGVPLATSIRAVKPDARLKTYWWRDDDSRKVREDFSSQYINRYGDVQEKTILAPTPWHSGSLVRRIERTVIIKADDRLVKASDFKKAVLAKYGRPIETERNGRITKLIYPVAGGEVSRISCWSDEHAFYHPSHHHRENVYPRYEEALADIDAGRRCGGVLTITYTEDSKIANRVTRYVTLARDFRLEVIAGMHEYDMEEAAARAHEAATPTGAPDL